MDGNLLTAARTTWEETVAAGERNAQATVLAPTGTINLLMDCDTTGVEPDFSMVKFKELVGGGQMTIVNRTVPLALQRLGYSDEHVEQMSPTSTSTAPSSALPASTPSDNHFSTAVDAIKSCNHGPFASGPFPSLGRAGPRSADQQADRGTTL